MIAESVCPYHGTVHGDDYSYASRISGATGIPAILGWAGHEDQWRGGTAKARAGRFEDVNKLYSTTDMSEANAIMKKYDVNYIYVGALERTAYGEPALRSFNRCLWHFNREQLRYTGLRHPTGEVNPTP